MAQAMMRVEPTLAEASFLLELYALPKTNPSFEGERNGEKPGQQFPRRMKTVQKRYEWYQAQHACRIY